MIWDAEEFSYGLVDLSDKSTLHALFMEQFYRLPPCLHMLIEVAESYTEKHYSREITGLKRLSALRIFKKKSSVFST